MLTDEQDKKLYEIGLPIMSVDIQSAGGLRGTISEFAVEAVTSLYRLGIIPYADGERRLIEQFTTCCCLVNDAFNEYTVAVNYDELAKKIGLHGEDGRATP